MKAKRQILRKTNQLVAFASHPGGVEIVSDLAGMDATADYDDVGHTQEANEILEKFLIGPLKAGASVPVETKTVTPVLPKEEAPKKQEANVNIANRPSQKVVSAPPSVAKPIQQEDDSTTMLIAGAALAAVAAGLLLYRRSARA